MTELLMPLVQKFPVFLDQVCTFSAKIEDI